MRSITYTLVLLSLLISGLYAQRTVTLDTPVQARLGASEFSLNSFSFDRVGKQLIVGFREVGGDRSMTFTYSSDDFDAAFGFFVTPALEQKIITRLQTEGKLGPGAISP